MKKYNVLLTNDDGVNSKGLKALRGELAKYFNVFTVAPSSQMSGISNAITLNKFRRVKQVSKNVFAISGGTTADCVKYALYSFLKGKCDIVV
ncbi:MAG: 5'/3'-nucleotidase SurE, partial [Elusimicrobia bacterium]|nr:5'/3'-nucleotidase SurE [Elusimicrobiota bacterium]